MHFVYLMIFLITNFLGNPIAFELSNFPSDFLKEEEVIKENTVRNNFFVKFGASKLRYLNRSEGDLNNFNHMPIEVCKLRSTVSFTKNDLLKNKLYGGVPCKSAVSFDSTVSFINLESDLDGGVYYDSTVSFLERSNKGDLSLNFWLGVENF